MQMNYFSGQLEILLCSLVYGKQKAFLPVVLFVILEKVTIFDHTDRD